MTELLALINAMRAQPRACASGLQPAAPALRWNPRLAEAASGHAWDMAAHDFFSHTGSDGSSAGQRAAAAGVASWGVGENIGAGYGSAAAVVAGWASSPQGHCEALMNPAYTEMGGACGYGQDTDYGSYWALLLARTR